MKRSSLNLILIAVSLFLLSGCGFLTPQVDLKVSKPETEVTPYSDILYELGKMSAIYNAPLTKVQSVKILDNTGASHPLATGGEIQRDISEIMKSTLNSIGGKVLLVEYDPAYINNQIATGYSKFEKKAIPDVVVTGGITGFDRGLEVDSDNKDIGLDLVFPNIQSENDDEDDKYYTNWPPSTLLGATYSNSKKYGTARITLDFNLKDFTTLAGIPYMSVSNSMKVYKGLNEKSFTVTIFGPTFGTKGSVRKVQGRHQAIRVLVQTSMIQLVGRHLALPYWRLLGQDAAEDKFVVMKINNSYNALSEFDRLVKIQMWLLIAGEAVDLSGEMDEKTKTLLKKRFADFDLNKPAITPEIYREVYLSMPLDDVTLARRIEVMKLLQ